MTANKATRVMAYLKAEGWNLYPSTHAAIMTYAHGLDQSMSAKQLSAVSIKLYQTYGMGKMQGELHGA